MSLPQINLKELNNQLTGLGNRVNFDQISSAASEAINNSRALTTSSLSISAGTVSAGLESLTSEVDDLPEEATGVANKGLAIIADNPPGIQLTQELDTSAQSSLETITGVTAEISSAVSDVVFTLPTPEAVSDTFQTVANVTQDEVRTALSDLVPENLTLPAELSESQIYQDFSRTITAVNSSITNFLNQGFGQSIKDLIEATANPLDTFINSITTDGPLGLPKELKRDVIALIDAGNTLGAATIIAAYSDLSLEDIETQISGVSTNVESLINPYDPALDVFGTSSAPVYSIGENDGQWNGAATTITNKPSDDPEILAIDRSLVDSTYSLTGSEGVRDSLEFFSEYQISYAREKGYI